MDLLEEQSTRTNPRALKQFCEGQKILSFNGKTGEIAGAELR